jgi:hypothetical protein
MECAAEFLTVKTSNASLLQVVDLTARGSRKGGLTSRPTLSGARVERIDLLSEAHAYLRSDRELGFKGSGGSSSGFRGLGSSSANPWTVPEEILELSAKQKEAELEAAAKRRMEALAQELKKAERLLNTQVGCGKFGLIVFHEFWPIFLLGSTCLCSRSWLEILSPISVDRCQMPLNQSRWMCIAVGRLIEWTRVDRE